jgi:hypothetical protein
MHGGIMFSPLHGGEEHPKLIGIPIKMVGLDPNAQSQLRKVHTKFWRKANGCTLT